MTRVFLALLALPLLGLVAGDAAANTSRVVLLRSGPADTIRRRAETLLEAELRAGGFEVVLVDRSPTLALDAEIEATAVSLRPIAVLSLAAAQAGTAAEIWLSDRVTEKLVVRRIELGPRTDRDAAAELALRAVELLRGSLLEITVGTRGEERQARSSPPEEVARFVGAGAAGARRSFAQGFAVGLGGAAFTPVAASLAYAPAVRLSYGGGRFCMRLSLIGPASAIEAQAHDGPNRLGTAQIRRALGLVEGLLVFRPGETVQPFASLGAGLHHVRVQGRGASPLLVDREDAAYAAAADAGLGSAVRLGARAALAIELHVFALFPETRVVVADQPVAALGPVGALVSLGLTTSF